MSQFQQLLDAVLNDFSGEQTFPEIESLSDEYLGTIQKIDQLKNQLQDLYNDIDILKKKTLTCLAIIAKTNTPSADINLDEKLSISAGDNDAAFEIINNNFTVGDFSTQSPSELSNHLVTVILPEFAAGKGRLLIEGKESNLLALYARKKSLNAL